MKVRDALLSPSVLARLGRLAAVLATAATLDQLFLRFGVDLKTKAGLEGGVFFCLLAIVWLAAELIFFPRKIILENKTPTVSEPMSFSDALLTFAGALQRQGKVTTILEIRDSMSHLLHLLGEHRVRIALGEIALSAAVQTKDILRHSQILIDDLGWAAFMHGGGATLAESNIRRGIDIAGKVSPRDDRLYVEARLAVAKGYRHIAMMKADEGSAQSALVAATQAIKDIETNTTISHLYSDQIARDIAQIDHVRATLILREFNLEKGGKIEAMDSLAIKRAGESLVAVQKAAQVFERVSDYERLTKALTTEERVHAALGDNVGALEARAKRENVARMHSIRR